MTNESVPQKRTLFLITSSYPFGEFETFLETEFHYLEQAFDLITIIYTEPSQGPPRLQNPSIQVHYLPCITTKSDRWKYFPFLLNRYAIKEAYDLLFKDNKLPTAGILTAALGSLVVGNKLKKKLVELINENNLWKTQLYIYSYWCNNMATGVALFKIAFPESLCVSRAHGYDVYLERNQYHYLPMRRLIFSKLDQVHFVSSHGRNYSSIKFGDFKSFSVSYLGVEPKYLLNAISGRSGKLHLVSCSSVIPVKRIHLIVTSLSRIDKLQIQWTHIGGGKMLTEIKDLAKELLDVKPNIAFQFLGHLSNQDVLSFYSNNQVDLFINSSESEGLPVSIMEAFAFSIPVIAPDVGGIREIVQNGINGIIIGPEGDVEQIAEAITWFSSQDLKSRRIMSGKARLTWEQKFNAEVNYTDFVKQLVHV